MNIRNILVFITLIFYFNAAYGDSANFLQEKTMCYTGEDVYFNCTVGDKVVSVCGFMNFSPKTGYVKYRFGGPGKTEFEFPEDAAPPMRRFSISDFSIGNVSTALLKFKSGAYIYVVFESAVSGLYIKRDGKTVRSLLCDGGQYSHISPKAKRGIKTVPPEDED